ncbi:nicotinate-nucleotide pyrophosphorylase (carboxylating) [Deinobacterium chartae]|uniref:Probable nicotinate-nucleotide pyrophosphorylase [carboxylating] n=1 Tax=Deinobacterium chartae TaxID=521158 RepID=A0A841HWA7_9DEIO|nr:carboxylating nicotinate-nucleotide diphosphorylase [Deinobacterium chartae]MBB6097677.1 nicotinate-nucleotide pyrophosphorylase (carboxylating) [Deinobacterium chartae]
MLPLSERLRFALEEDLGRGDLTTLATVPAGAQGRASFDLKQAGVLFGLEVARQVFALVDPRLEVHWSARDGDFLEPLDRVSFGEVRGELRSILVGERLALNLLQRLSGVATLTRRYAAALEGTRTRLLDTRKTTPLWRDLEKAAVRAGGGFNHRFGLDDGILIKDNHVASAGGVRAAVEAALGMAYLIRVECEVTRLSELREALEAGAERILLDNMDDDTLREAVRLRDRLAPGVSLEASGNMTLERLPKVAATGVDFVSVGALTHSAPALDISLNVTEALR